MLNGTKTVIQHKIGLLNLAEELGNVSKACRIMGLSRDTFYRYQNAVEQGGVGALVDRNRRKPNIKNRVDEKTEVAVVAYAVEPPPTNKSVPAANCVSGACSFRPVVFDVCGCVTNWVALKTD